jgi:UDP-N-acetylmuramyl pentapeptide phosphotransferase/UDP-N-acetylglucosamine-1-phosphate transferase
MALLLISFVTALVITALVIRFASHVAVLGDTDQDSPQKFHARVVPRVGGVGIAIAIALGLAAAIMSSDAQTARTMLTLGCCSAVVFAAGFIEDLTKRVTPRERMLATVLAAAAAAWLANIVIERTDIPGIDPLLDIFGFSMLLTLLSVAGVVNSVNLIDGFNGLASMCVAIILAALAYVAYQVGDMLVMQCALITLGAVLGFFVWNYPFGLIFLGDGGAYLLGFWVAELGILLVQRNPSVSPMFPLLLCAYPMFETLFTMYRRKVIRGRPVGQPDAAHLHSLIYRRTMRWAVGKRDASNLLRRNSMTSPYLWVLCSLSAIPAVLFWEDSDIMGWCIGAFCLLYLGLYRAIVHFRTPRLLLRKGEHWAAEKTAKTAG